MATPGPLLVYVISFLLIISIYLTWTTGNLFGIIPILCFGLLLPYEFAKTFLARKKTSRS
jgi:hypothetical protein